MTDKDNTPILGLIALKLVCCGGLLLATGVISAGSFLTLVNHPAAKIGGLIAVALALWMFLRRRRVRAPSGGAPLAGSRADDRNSHAA